MLCYVVHFFYWNDFVGSGATEGKILELQTFEMVIYLFFNLLINLRDAVSKLEGELGATSTWELLEKYSALEVRRDKEFL